MEDKDRNYFTWCPLCLKGVLTETVEDANQFKELHRGHDGDKFKKIIKNRWEQIREDNPDLYGKI